MKLPSCSPLLAQCQLTDSFSFSVPPMLSADDVEKEMQALAGLIQTRRKTFPEEENSSPRSYSICRTTLSKKNGTSSSHMRPAGLPNATAFAKGGAYLASGPCTSKHAKMHVHCFYASFPRHQTALFANRWSVIRKAPFIPCQPALFWAGPICLAR